MIILMRRALLIQLTLNSMMEKITGTDKPSMSMVREIIALKRHLCLLKTTSPHTMLF